MANVGVVGHWQSYPDILDDLGEGDIVEFDRSLFSHFGVYIGRQGTAHYIIHKVGDGFELFSTSSSASSSRSLSSGSKDDRERCTNPTKGVRQDFLEAVCAGKKCRINNRIDKDFRLKCLYPKEIIVDRCCAKLTNCSYNLTTDNCEHFANWCRTDLSVSYQVQIMPQNVRLIVAPTAGILVKLILWTESMMTKERNQTE